MTIALRSEKQELLTIVWTSRNSKRWTRTQPHSHIVYFYHDNNHFNKHFYKAQLQISKENSTVTTFNHITLLCFCTVQCDMIIQHRNSHFSNWYFNSIFQFLTSSTCFTPHWFILRKTVVNAVLYGMFTCIGVSSLAGIEHTLPPVCKTDDYTVTATSPDLKRYTTGDWSFDICSDEDYHLLGCDVLV